MVFPDLLHSMVIKLTAYLLVAVFWFFITILNAFFSDALKFKFGFLKTNKGPAVNAPETCGWHCELNK